ncbi:heterokaryon incompatibility protein-domain-containing protein [Colletotrichum lupini]|nr:heterokaryon incompatibility protein-domain-containing protein [Colletotrichum lupini]
MWLINVDTLQLEEFIEPDFPYAILSHTWASEEVSFQELKNQRDDNAWRKSGYHKIHNTCRVAKSLDLGYVWVDTCCIDKASSAELSEAINSMFRWYNRSCICFAYLSDVNDLAGSATLLEKLRASRWFTRGWTLQELIAPKVVTFYNASWQLLGSKDTLSPFLSSITGIDEAILIGKAPLLKVPVATRMSWASKRQTTRTEDSAYCLLGIFDINMPLLYGEGEKAFARLQSEIMQETNDLSLLAWASSVTDPERQEEYSGLLAKSPSDFIACSNLKLINNMTLSEDFEVGVTRTKFSIKTVLWYIDGFGDNASTRDEAGYVLPLHCSFLNPDLPKPTSSRSYGDGNSILIGVMIAKTSSGFVRYKPWSLIAQSHSLQGRSAPSLPGIQVLKSWVYDEKVKPVKLVRHLTSEAALEMQSTRLKNAIFVSVDIQLLNDGPFETLHAQPSALWDRLNRVFLDKVKQEAVRNATEARFLHFCLRSGEKVLLICAITEGLKSRSRQCWAALLNYEEDEMGRWMIDQLGKWDETSTSYATARHMLVYIVRGGYKTYPFRPALQLCPIEYFATSTNPASRTIRLSDGTEEEVTVSIAPHDAAEGACEVIVSFKKGPQLSPGNSSDAVVD